MLRARRQCHAAQARVSNQPVAVVRVLLILEQEWGANLSCATWWPRRASPWSTYVPLLELEARSPWGWLQPCLQNRAIVYALHCTIPYACNSGWILRVRKNCVRLCPIIFKGGLTFCLVTFKKLYLALDQLCIPLTCSPRVNELPTPEQAGLYLPLWPEKWTRLCRNLSFMRWAVRSNIPCLYTTKDYAAMKQYVTTTVNGNTGNIVSANITSYALEPWLGHIFTCTTFVRTLKGGCVGRHVQS